MSYLLKSNRPKKIGIRLTAYSLAFFLLLILMYWLAPRFVNEKLYAVARPVWTAKNYVSDFFSKIAGTIKSKNDLVARNVFLEEELADAQISLQILDSIRKENAHLKEIIGRPTSEKRLLATVIETPNHTLYDTLILDVGERNGVSIGDKIIRGDYIIGNIREVYTDHSKAVLFSSDGEIVDVIIGDKHIRTEATGRGGGNFIARLPKDVEIYKGDLVSAPVINSKFFGVVENIEQTASGTFQSILFSLPINLYELRWVEISK